MKKVLLFLLYYALIPFIVSFAGIPAAMAGPFDWGAAAGAVIVPLLAALIVFLLRRKLDALTGLRICGGILGVLLVVFTVMMVISSGNVGGPVMTGYASLIMPFLPLMILLMLMQKYGTLYLTAMLTYAAMAAVFAALAAKKVRVRVLAGFLAGALVCAAVSGVMYARRPEARYGGHGFKYMHGYSSTDFTDYMVFSEPSRLAELSGPAPFVIENEEDMPVMDGAEACYPLYAAAAKAVYKDIDRIERDWPERTSSRLNGKIVTFTNTIMGFERLIWGADANAKDGADLFIGARPSGSQLEWAAQEGVELLITPIGREAFVFFTKKDNPVSSLSADQLRGIYHGDISSWKEVGGKDREILPFQRPAGSGSQTMMEWFMGDVSLKEPKTYEKVDSMSGVISHVAQYANEAGALGYSFRYFVEELDQEKGVKLLSVDGVAPTLENIENGSYPLTVDLCLITRKGDPNPNVEKMRQFFLSDSGQELVRKTGYAGLK